MCSKCNSKEHKKVNNCHDGCVEEILEAILKAQWKVKKDQECSTSCHDSIKDLIGESRKSKKNTIPFILYCGDCSPFKASGVTTVEKHCKKKKFVCITSFIFRIKDLEDNCAVLELLTFNSDKKCDYKEPCSPCSQINHEDVDDLVATGICINVDLSCFCAVTCLPAVHV
ncbi:CotY/CotZ family spore coat protein [Metabacillus sp. Hm71]|uniref:CotY/CotZ family spore coat protein n=1 Tax=Metabacillus sp. Hm71 TaxID=3450743 RepID=UPI003F43355C